jgi:hypothetical protein
MRNLSLTVSPHVELQLQADVRLVIEKHGLLPEASYPLLDLQLIDAGCHPVDDLVVWEDSARLVAVNVVVHLLQ